MVDALILGAGPAGLTAGFKLSEAGKKVILIEKNDRVGGLARTLSFGEFRTDIGPHRFFSKNQALYSMIQSLLGESWIKVNRFTHFYIRGKFYRYPIKITDTLRNLGPIGSFKCAADFACETIKKQFNKKPHKS